MTLVGSYVTGLMGRPDIDVNDESFTYLYGWSEGSQLAVKHSDVAGLILQGAVARTDRQTLINEEQLTVRHVSRASPAAPATQNDHHDSVVVVPV